MFRSFVEPTLSTTLKLLLSVQSTNLEVMSCLGRVLSALITTVGPELAMDQPDIVKGNLKIYKLAYFIFICEKVFKNNL